MANKSKTTNTRWIAARIAEIMTGETELSYHLLRTLTETKYLKPVFEKTGEGRGRPTKKYEVTSEGKRLVRIAAFWPSKA